MIEGDQMEHDSKAKPFRRTPVYEKAGGSAHPVRLKRDDGGTDHHYGMSMRDYFAGQALAGLLASELNYAKMGEYAESAYEAADAMLVQRTKPPK
jgi:hypothetical protein